jgi:transcriptional regulator with XRE-family HTH domain
MMNRSPQRIEGLREARRRAGLTQQRLADLAALPRQHVSAIELHHLLLTEDRARKLARHLGIHPAALVVGHAAAPILRGANKASVTENDFRALLRAFSAARTTDESIPRLRLDLVRIVRQMSETLFAVWYRILDDAERDAERALEAGPG